MQARLEDSQRQANELQIEKNALAAQQITHQEAIVRCSRELSERVRTLCACPGQQFDLLHCHYDSFRLTRLIQTSTSQHKAQRCKQQTVLLILSAQRCT